MLMGIFVLLYFIIMIYVGIKHDDNNEEELW